MNMAVKPSLGVGSRIGPDITGIAVRQIKGKEISLLLDPATTAYWDGIHPTTAVHQIIAAEAWSSIPEPSVGLLAMLGCGLMLVVRRRV